jgi:hypothetical protein
MERNCTSFPTQAAAFLRAAHRRYLELRAEAQSAEREQESPSATAPGVAESRAAQVLKYYQFLVRAAFLEPGFAKGGRGFFIYHAMGMGKTYLALALALAALEKEGRRPVVLAPKSLHSNFRESLRQLIEMLRGPGAGAGEDFERRLAGAAERFRYVSIDAHNAARQLVREAAGLGGRKRGAKTAKDGQRQSESGATGALEGCLLIVDEAHNFFRAIVNSGSEHTNARRLYEMVMATRDLRLVFLSGTPASKDPFELVPCFNMLTRDPDLLPNHYDTFYQLYVRGRQVRNRSRLANRLAGLVSYAGYELLSPEARAGFPEERPTRVEEVPMGTDQYRQYLVARQREQNEGGSGPPRRGLTRAKGPLSLPGAERSGGSTYHVRSRAVGNWAPPRELAPRVAGDYSRCDLAALPPQAFGAEQSPKIDRLLANLADSPGPALVYSQFVGGGGLAAVARYLDLAGYKQITAAELPAPPAEAEGGASPPAQAGPADEPAGGGAAEAARAAGRRPWEAVDPARGAKVLAAWQAALEPAGAQYNEAEQAEIRRLLAEELPAGAAPHWYDAARDLGGVRYRRVRRSALPRPHCAHNLHLGQRKLFLGELELLSGFAEAADAPLTVVYAGAGPGVHIPFFAAFFPRAHFYLYDPVGFVGAAHRHPRLHCHAEPFDDRLAGAWAGHCDIFVSDVRGGSERTGRGRWSTSHERRVWQDMRDQERWARLARPRLGSMLKFRPPYLPEAKQLRYLRGDVFWQTWPPAESGEGRLVSTADDLAAAPVLWDVEHYENAFYRYNALVRPWATFAPDERAAPAGFDGVPGYDRCADCTREARAWLAYLSLPQGREVAAGLLGPTEAPAAALMRRLSRELEQPLVAPRGAHGHWPRLSAASRMAELLARLQSQGSGRAGSGSSRQTAKKGGAEQNNTEASTATTKRRYAVISGEVSAETRTRIQALWNSPENIRGERLFVLLVSKTGAEGLDLKYGRQVHMLEPYWDKTREDQVRARLVRLNSHIDLPPDERVVQPFLYVATANPEVLESLPQRSREDGDGTTVDQRFHRRAAEKYELSQDFRALLREVAIECPLRVSEAGGCHVCAPTGEPLYTAGPGGHERDLRLPNPCRPLEQQEVEVAGTIAGPAGEEYYYAPDPAAPLGWRFFRYDEELEGYVAVPYGAPLYTELAERAKKQPQ